jgi:hypothetical protein
VAEVASRALLAGVLFGCVLPAHATPFGEAMEAIKSNDCQTLGDVVNRHLDTSTPVKYLVGAMFEEGLCVERDLAKAARYYALADEGKSADAARDMGFEYVTGVHLPRSYTRAGAWFAKSLMIRREGSSELKFPAGIPALPVPGASPGSEWAGYLMSVGFIASRTQRYPGEALRLRTEGEFVAKVCVHDGTVRTTAVMVQPGPSGGVATLQGKREILTGIEENYEKVLTSMPPPVEPAPGPMCFHQPLNFRIR